MLNYPFQIVVKRAGFFGSCRMLLVVVMLVILIISDTGCKKKNDAKSSAAIITTFSFSKLTPVVTGSISGTTINLLVPDTIDRTKLVATFTLSNGATVKVGDSTQVSGVTANDFTNDLTYTVTAQDGTTTQEYVVTVNIQTASTKAITGFSFSKLTPVVTGIISGTTIVLIVPAVTDIKTLVATFMTTGATVKVGDSIQVSGVTANDFTNDLTYTVTAQDGTTQAYTVIVPKASVAELASFSFSDPTRIIAPVATIDRTNHIINVMVAAGADVTKLVANFIAFGSVKVAWVTQVSGTTPNDFSNPNGVPYTVASNDGTSTVTYTVKVTKSDYAVIPDANFRKYIRDLFPGAFNGSGYNEGKLNLKDPGVATRTLINVQNSNIADLTGIEYFVGLTELNFPNNNLTSLDISKNPLLTNLWCDNNNLTALDVSKNPRLMTLSCDNNNLTSLDVSNNLKLDILECNYNNNLTSLNVSNHPHLRRLSCSETKITSLDLSKDTSLVELECQFGILESLDISSQKWWNILTIYSAGHLTTVKVNVLALPYEEVALQLRGVKILNKSSVISTYTTSSADASPACSDYDPIAKNCTTP